MISRATIISVSAIVLIAGHRVPSQAATNRILRVGGSGDYRALQDAITDSRDGDTIQVAQGVYTENIRLAVSKSITIQGGWNFDFSSRVEDVSLTVVDGSGRGSVFEILANRGVAISISVESLTIRNGKAALGAGVNATAIGPNARLTLALVRSRITGNAASGSGGGVYAHTDALGGPAALVLSAVKNQVDGNTAGDTGGGFAVGSHAGGQVQVELTGNLVTGNTAVQSSAGMWFNSDLGGAKTEANLKGNVISGNSGPQWNGGGVAAYSGENATTVMVFTDNSIVGNSSGYGGGICLSAQNAASTMEATLSRNLIAGNHASSHFGGLVVTATDSASTVLQMSGNTVTQNTAPSSSSGLSVISGDNQMPLGTDTSQVMAESRDDFIWGNGAPGSAPDLEIWAYATSDPATVKASFSAFGTVTNHIGVFTPTNCIIGTSRN